MRILKMTATFGCLDQAILEPEAGLNQCVLPNESGKSTWAAFLVAMFYGLDTSQRSVKGRLAEKTRYQPWNGKSMEGTIELEHQGRRLVIQRTSQRGKPMGCFRAWDRDTGLDLPDLTGETCGRILLGVERSVFRRSAFLSGGELQVSQDQELARRLAALAASGSQQDSYPAAEARLKLWQNRCRYHQTGLIPETEGRLRQVEGTLEAMEELRRRRLAVSGELETCTVRLQALEEDRKRRQDARRVLNRDALEQAHLRAETLESRTALLPQEEDLLQLRARLQAGAESTAEEEPTCPPALEGLSAAQILPKAQADLQIYDRLTAARKWGVRRFGIPALVLLVLAGGCALQHWWLPAGVGGLLALVLGSMWLLGRRHREKTKAAVCLLADYGAEDRALLLEQAVARRDWLLTRERRQEQEWELELLLEQTASFAPEAQTRQEAAEAVEQALQLRKQLTQARWELERAQLQWQTAARETADPEAEALGRQCAALTAERDSLVRQEAALGGWESLEAQRQQLERELELLTRREQALALARAALSDANDRLAQIYAPPLTRLAGEYLCRLTGGRYEALILGESLELSARETGGLIRPLAALSRGTQDQAWLALRLAMTALLLPPDTPIVLDDALLTFDRQRERAALDVLREEGRQILLFSCR